MNKTYMKLLIPLIALALIIAFSMSASAAGRVGIT